MKEIRYLFDVKVIREGQPRPYADSEYEYEIISEQSEFMVKRFCTYCLKECHQAYSQWDKSNADSYFRGYYVFDKTDENTYKYRVKQPFCD